MSKEAFVKRLKGIDELEKELAFAKECEAALGRANHALIDLCERLLEGGRVEVEIAAYTRHTPMMRSGRISKNEFEAELHRIQERLSSELNYLCMRGIK